VLYSLSTETTLLYLQAECFEFVDCSLSDYFTLYTRPKYSTVFLEKTLYLIPVLSHIINGYLSHSAAAEADDDPKV
jgi:hypothetical protein